MPDNGEEAAKTNTALHYGFFIGARTCYVVILPISFGPNFSQVLKILAKIRHPQNFSITGEAHHHDHSYSRIQSFERGWPARLFVSLLLLTLFSEQLML